MYNTPKVLGSGIHGIYQIDTSGQSKKIISNGDNYFNDIELEPISDSVIIAIRKGNFYDKAQQTIESSYHLYKITHEFENTSFLDSTGGSIIKKYWFSKGETISSGLIYKYGGKDSGYYQFNEEGILRRIGLNPDTTEEIKDVLVNKDASIWIVFERSSQKFKYDKYIHKIVYVDRYGTPKTFSGFEASNFNEYYLLDQGKVLLLDARVLLKLERESNDPSGIFLINKDSSNVKQLFAQEQVDNLLTANKGNYFIVSVKTKAHDPEKVLVLNPEGKLLHTVGTFPLTRVLFSTFGLEKDVDNDNIWAITSEGKLYYISGDNNFHISTLSIPIGKHVIEPISSGIAQLYTNDSQFPSARITFDGKQLKNQEIVNTNNDFRKTFLLNDKKHYLVNSKKEITYVVDSNENKLTIGADSFHLKEVIAAHSENALDRIWVTTLNGAFLLIHASKILRQFEITPNEIRLNLNRGVIKTGILVQNIQVNIYANGHKIGTGYVNDDAKLKNQITVPFNLLNNESYVWNKDLKIVISFKNFNNSTGVLEISDVRFNIPFYKTKEFYTIIVFLVIVLAIFILQVFKEKIPVTYKYGSFALWFLGLLTTLFKDKLSTLVNGHIDWILLGVLLLSGLIILTLLCIVFPNILKSVGDQFPFDILSIGLFKLPSFKKRFFQKYLDALEHRIKTERGATIDSKEVYVPIPATFTNNGSKANVIEPVTELISLLSKNEKGFKAAIIAPGGQGKSALLRESVYQYIQLYRQDASLPIPIYINGSNGNAGDFEALLRDHLSDYLVPTDFNTQHKRIKSGDYLIIIDDITEVYGSKNFLKNFEGGKQEYRKLSFIITLRPHEADVTLVSSINNCKIIHPLKIKDNEINIFEAAYLPAGEALPPSLRNICRTNDGSYQPILVRLAIFAYKASVNNITQLYEAAIRHLLEKNVSKNEFESMEASMARMCKDSYGKNGEREISYRPNNGQLITVMEKASLLLRTDRDNIFGNLSKRYRFLHDSVQTYLAAVGYLYDSSDPKELFFKFATEPFFVKDQSDFLFNNGAEIYQIGVMVFENFGTDVKGILKSSLNEWVTKYKLEYSIRDILNAIPKSERKKLEVIKNSKSPSEIFSCCIEIVGDKLPLIAEFYYRFSQTVYRY